MDNNTATVWLAAINMVGSALIAVFTYLNRKDHQKHTVKLDNLQRSANTIQESNEEILKESREHH